MHGRMLGVKQIYFITILLFIAIFIFIYSYNTFTPAFITPDETINYAFSNLYSKTGHLYYEEELNSVARDIIRPRGVLVHEGKLVPTKFIGFPFYYGTFTVILGDVSLPYFTLILAGIGALSLYLLGKELFGWKNGVIASFLLLVLPPYWYWSNYPLFENVFASVFFVLGLVYFFKTLKIKSLKYYIFAPLFLGISWNVRPDTTLFLIPLTLILILNIKKFDLKFLAISLIIFLLTISPILSLNNELYGGYLTTVATVHPSPGLLWQKDWISVLFTNLGGLVNVIPLSPFLVIGFFLCFLKKHNWQSNLRKMYALFVLSSFLIFSLFYLTGFPPKYGGGLHESYTRYFLPMYLVSLPLFTLFIQKLRGLRNTGEIITVLFILTFVIGSINTIPTLEGIWNVRKSYAQTTNYIINNTEPNSVIFVWGLDKIIYPERRVATIDYLPNKGRERVLADIAIKLFESRVPLYVYEYGPLDLSLFQNELKQHNLGLIKIDGGALYRIISTNEVS